MIPYGGVTNKREHSGQPKTLFCIVGLVDCIQVLVIISVGLLSSGNVATCSTNLLKTVRDTIGTAIYFGVYESGKQLFVKFQGSSSPTSPLPVAIAGGLCGLVSWACVSICIWPFRPPPYSERSNDVAYRYIPLIRLKHTINGIV